MTGSAQQLSSAAGPSARVPVRRTYVRVDDGSVIARDSVIENHRGEWVQHLTSGGTRDYSYDRLGRLVGVSDVARPSGTCSVRTYAFDTHSNRTGSTSWTGDSSESCEDADAATAPVTTVYDSGDRVVSNSADPGQWVHDPMGRVTAMPFAGTQVQNGYFVNDRVASQEIPGAARVSWGIDPMLRRSTFVTSSWVDEEWGASTTKTSHYDSDSDEPSWISEDVGDANAVTRYVGGVEGDVAFTTSLSGDREIQLVDLHGDIVATLPIADGAAEATWAGLRFTSFDEFGVPQPMVGAGATNAPPTRYGWLGASQRSAEALGGVILMGARLYSPTMGRFLQIDPVAGGSASAYDYCNADPVNCSDLDGEWPSWKSVLKAVAFAGEIASMVPGPVGAVAGVVSGGAYLALGDKKKALLAVAGGAAALVGAGALVKVGAKFAAPAFKMGRAALRNAPKVMRAAQANRKVERALAPSKAGAALYRSRIFGAKSRLFGDIHSGAAAAGRLNRGRFQIGWSGARVVREGQKAARTVFRVSVRGSSKKRHVDLIWGPFR